MKKELEINEELKKEIDVYLSRLILGTLELDYNLDYLTNEILFQNKEKVIDKVREIVQNFADKKQITQRDILKYLRNIYSKKYSNAELRWAKNEYIEAIQIVNGLDEEDVEK